MDVLFAPELLCEPEDLGSLHACLRVSVETSTRINSLKRWYLMVAICRSIDRIHPSTWSWSCSDSWFNWNSTSCHAAWCPGLDFEEDCSSLLLHSLVSVWDTQVPVPGSQFSHVPWSMSAWFLCHVDPSTWSWSCSDSWFSCNSTSCHAAWCPGLHLEDCSSLLWHSLVSVWDTQVPVLGSQFSLTCSKFQVPCECMVALTCWHFVWTMQLGSAEPNHISLRDSCTQSRCSHVDTSAQWRLSWRYQTLWVSSGNSTWRPAQPGSLQGGRAQISSHPRLRLRYRPCQLPAEDVRSA